MCGVGQRPLVTHTTNQQHAKLPNTSILEAGRLPVKGLAALARRETQRRTQRYQVHRWFARRPSSQFRGLLAGAMLPENRADAFWDVFYSDAAILNGLTVMDPFMGGGTTLMEATRFGATVVGMDIDPVPVTISRFQLTAAEVRGLEDELSELQTTVGDDLARYHRTVDADGNDREVLYHFWVQVTDCHSCGEELEIHPRFQLARDPSEDNQIAFCRHCHSVQKLALDREILVCDKCDRRTHIHAGTLRDGTVHCLACGANEELAENSDRRDCPPTWRLFAQQYLERHGDGPRQVSRRYKAATDKDCKRYRAAEEALETIGEDLQNIPERAIPVEGRSDSRPVLHGFTKYRDLFNSRQLLHLHKLSTAIQGCPNSDRRLALSLAFSEHLTTNCMLVGYAFSYERTSPLFSYQAFRHITRPVEVNPWLRRIGRGTYPNAVLKLDRACNASRTPADLSRDGGKVTSEQAVGVDGPISHTLGDTPGNSVITTCSAEHTAELPRDSIELVVTDPPYGDNINYSELSDFYLAWHQVLDIAPPPYDDPERHAPLQTNLAADGREKDTLAPYRDVLGTVFREVERVLTPSGMLIFTFQHSDPNTWLALGEALAQSDFRVSNVIPLLGNSTSGLRSDAGRIKWDATLVCRTTGGSSPQPGHMYIADAAQADVRKRVSEWDATLSGGDLGFEAPDRVNLMRALLLQAAMRPDGADGLPYHDALRSARNEAEGWRDS